MSSSPLSITPSGAQILEKVAKGTSATVAELSSDLQLSPTEIRSDLSDLQDKGLAELEDDKTVLLTEEGKQAYELITKHPEIVEVTPPVIAKGTDVDAAIEQILEKDRAEQSAGTTSVHPMDNRRDDSSELK